MLLAHPLPSTFPSPLLPKTPFSNPRFIPRAEMTSSSSTSSFLTLPPVPENRIVLGCGAAVVDYLATVVAYPKPDEKIRSTSLKVEGGGNVGNALTGAARLGLLPRVISKIGNDAQGRNVLAEFEKDGVDTSYMVVSEEGNTPFTYIIVDNQTKTRTCIHTPGSPMLPEELPESKLHSAIDGAKLVYFDVRLHETALVVAKETARRKIPILIDAEKLRDGLDDLLNLATYVVCSENFPQQWTSATSIPTALVSMFLRLPNLKFVIVTLGEKGCLMLERSTTEATKEEEKTDIENLVDSLKQKLDLNSTIPTCIASKGLKLSADGIGDVSGRILIGTSEVIPPEEIIDTTGAGDAFIGAVLYALCAGMPPDKMLPFASKVAATNCRALGARSGLPLRTDPRLAAF